MIRLSALNLKRLKGYADWQLLLFLVLFLNVKLVVKVIAIVLIYLLQFNFKFGFKFKNSRLPLFYPLIIVIAVFNLLVFGNISNIRYDFVFLSGLSFWLLSILAIHQIKLAVERNTVVRLHQTITVFFVLNAVVSLFMLAAIIWETKALNPYQYQGMYQKYFISTGDYIRGITFDVSITNSVLNALGVIYFMAKKNAPLLLLCMMVLLFTGSNALNIITAGILVVMFIGYSNRSQKSLIIVCFALLVIFSVKISPQNSNYALHISQKFFGNDTALKPIVANPDINPSTLKPDSIQTYNEQRERYARRYLDSQYTATLLVTEHTHTPTLPVAPKLIIPQPNINAKPYQEAADTTVMQHKLLTFITDNQTDLPMAGGQKQQLSLPGKAIALLETVKFLWHHPQNLLTGNGIGNFSSKIAFKATNFGLTGGYPAKYIYINPVFLRNHLDVYLNFFSKNIGLHSVINNPNAVYFQLLGEYGLTGFVVFIIWYLGYFLKHYRVMSYGVLIIGFTLAIFFLEYWFEQLSVMILIELILLTNIKEHKITAADAN